MQMNSAESITLPMSCIAKTPVVFYVCVFLCLSICMHKVMLLLCGNSELWRNLPGGWQVTQEPKTFLILHFSKGFQTSEQNINEVYVSVKRTSSESLLRI